MLALGLNVRLDPTLLNLDLRNIGTQVTINGRVYRQFCTQGTNPDGTLIPGDFRTLTIAQSVIDALLDPSIVGAGNVGKGSGLLSLANRALAGMPTANAGISDINAAVDAINSGFDKRRIPDSMGVALVLNPRRSERSQACISLDPREYLTRKTADATIDHINHFSLAH